MNVGDFENLFAEPTVLDCTLRDGGYCNKWNFERDLVEKLSAAAIQASIANLEIGFRSLRNSQILGPWAFCTDDYLSTYSWHEDLNLWVMINAGEFLDAGTNSDIRKLFRAKNESPLYGVRIATVYRHLAIALKLVPILKSLGYRVAVNLMQAGSVLPDELEIFGKQSTDANPDLIYIADTNGCMTPDDVFTSVTHLAYHWPGKIGFHGHNNLGFALQNAAYALMGGATFVDATVLGMGRGAGNLRTEEVMTYKHGAFNSRRLAPLFDLANKEMRGLLKEFEWGYHPLFLISGMRNIHPDYAIESIESLRGHAEEGIESLSRIPRDLQFKYAANQIADTLKLESQPTNIDENYFEKRHVDLGSAILIGAGATATDMSSILPFAQRYEIEMFALNDEVQDWDHVLSGRFFANPSKFYSRLDFIKSTTAPIIAPFNRVLDSVETILKSRKASEKPSILYGVEDQIPGEPPWHDIDRCVLSRPISFPYALYYLSAAKVKNLFLVGLDGYSSSDDPRFLESQDAIDRFTASGQAQIVSLTSTNYRVQKISPYGPAPTNLQDINRGTPWS